MVVWRLALCLEAGAIGREEETAAAAAAFDGVADVWCRPPEARPVTDDGSGVLGCCSTGCDPRFPWA